jgi:pantoate--beta-alanine ligase
MKQVTRAARSEGRVAGLVPTMGALHEGHISLIRAAKQQCAPVVVSIFVNPTQFGPGEDFEKYPRQWEADRQVLESLSVDYLFAPSSAEIYPKGFRTHVEVEGLSDRLEGRVRPGHFRGVATVVLKLLEIVQPHFAYFGRKDAQQACILQRMALDLDLDSVVVACPIVREPDGLAMSSRNAYLSAGERRSATVLFCALDSVRQEIEKGERDSVHLLARARAMLAAEPSASVDYVELVDAKTLEPVMRLHGSCLLLLAARLGKTRLIDNALIEENGGSFRVSL